MVRPLPKIFMYYEPNFDVNTNKNYKLLSSLFIENPYHIEILLYQLIREDTNQFNCNMFTSSNLLSVSWSFLKWVFVAQIYNLLSIHNNQACSKPHALPSPASITCTLPVPFSGRLTCLIVFKIRFITSDLVGFSCADTKVYI